MHLSQHPHPLFSPLRIVCTQRLAKNKDCTHSKRFGLNLCVADWVVMIQREGGGGTERREGPGVRVVGRRHPHHGPLLGSHMRSHRRRPGFLIWQLASPSGGPPRASTLISHFNFCKPFTSHSFLISISFSLRKVSSRLYLNSHLSLANSPLSNLFFKRVSSK